MTDYSKLVEHTLFTGVAATAATTLAVSICGALEEGNAIAPINAVSHIAWADKAAHQTDASWQYTAVGLALNAAAVTSWAGVYEVFCGRTADRKDIAGALLGGALVSAVAYVTDYHVVPRRLTPGFEKRLSNRSLFGVYTALALSLAAGSLVQPGRLLPKA